MESSNSRNDLKAKRRLSCCSATGLIRKPPKPGLPQAGIGKENREMNDPQPHLLAIFRTTGSSSQGQTPGLVVQDFGVVGSFQDRGESLTCVDTRAD